MIIFNTVDRTGHFDRYRNLRTHVGRLEMVVRELTARAGYEAQRILAVLRVQSDSALTIHNELEVHSSELWNLHVGLG